jgi:hypothetical protein
MTSGARQGWRTRSWVVDVRQPLAAPERLRRGPAPWLWSALLTATALGLCTLPLFDVLGYEFAFALCPLTTLAGFHLGARAVRIARDVHAARASDWRVWSYAELRLPAWAAVDLWISGASATILTLVPPLLLGLLNALRVRNCDLLSGVLFFALLPVTTAVVAAGLAVVCALGVGQGGPRRRRPSTPEATEVPEPHGRSRTAWALALALLVALGTVLVTILRFYNAPPVFLYDPFMGYFPGALYDEDVRVAAPLLWARLYHVCWTAAGVTAAGLWLRPTELRLGFPSLARLGEQSGTLAAGLTFLVAGGALHWAGPTCGFRFSGADIAERLGGVRETAHFRLVYDRRALSTTDVELAALDHELRWSQLDALLGIHPQGKVTSYLFADGGSKRRLMGAEQTFVAKPWRNEIYLQWEGFPHRVLKHELAHVFAGAFGDPRFGITWRPQPLDELLGLRGGWLARLLHRIAPPVPNMALVEGVAVAAAWSPDDRLSTHGWARAMVDTRLDLPMKALLGLGFYRAAATRSYTLAGSFCRYLLDTYGAGKLRALYWLGGDFAAVYHRSAFELERKWRGYLATLPLADDERAVARERFGQRSIFARPCAHALARRRKEADAALARGDARLAAELLADVCQDDPTDLRHALALARAHFRAGLPHEAGRLLDAIQRAPNATAPIATEALILAGDAAYFRDDGSKARAFWTRAAALPTSSGERRAALARLAALKEAEIGGRLVRAITHDPTRPPPAGGVATIDLLHLSEVAGTHPGSGLALYLLGRQLMALDGWADALPYLDRAVQAGLPDQLFYIEALRSIGRAGYLLHDLVRARRAWKQLGALPFLPAGVRVEALDWLDRLDREPAVRKAVRGAR